MLRSLAHTLSTVALLGLSAAGCGGTATATHRTTSGTSTASSTEAEPAGSSEPDPHQARGTWEHDCELRRQAQCPAGCRMIGPAGPAQTASSEDDTSFRDDVEIGPERPTSLSGMCSSAASGTETACLSFCCTGCPRE